MPDLVPAWHDGKGILCLQGLVDLLPGIFCPILESFRWIPLLYGLVPYGQDPAGAIGIAESLVGIYDTDYHTSARETQRISLDLGNTTGNQTVWIEANCSNPLLLHQSIQLWHIPGTKKIFIDI